MNANEYRLLEYNGDEDEFWMVGNVVLRGEKFVTAEITDNIITTMKEVNQIREFLDEVAAFIDGESK